MSLIYTNTEEDPYLDAVKRRYELIETKIKDFHEKSNGKSQIMISEDYYNENSSEKRLKNVYNIFFGDFYDNLTGF